MNNFEHKNNQKAVKKVEENAFFNSAGQPDSQIAKIGVIDGNIEEIKLKIKNNNFDHLDSGSDYATFKMIHDFESLKDLLDSISIDKNTLIQEGIQNIRIKKNKEVEKSEDQVMKYPHNHEGNVILSINKLKKEIERRINYIDNLDRPLDKKTQESIEEGIQILKDQIFNLINQN